MISVSLEQHPFRVISEMYGSVAICKQSTVQWFPRDNQQRESPLSPPVRMPGQSGKQILNSSPASLLLPGRFFFHPRVAHWCPLHFLLHKKRQAGLRCEHREWTTNRRVCSHPSNSSEILHPWIQPVLRWTVLRHRNEVLRHLQENRLNHIDY